MTPQQLNLTAVLADLFLPTTAGASAPSALGIHDFVDEWISAPYPEQREDRAIIVDGLTWIESQSQRRWQRGFLQIEDTHRHELVESIVPTSSAAATAENVFFRRFRYIVVGAYYTTADGARDLGYIGNVPLPSYPTVTEKERAILDTELRKLGIGDGASLVNTSR
jgi:hypothetical protein